MSSPQYPARLLFVITTLSCTLTGCVSKQASSPEMADSSASDPTRDSFLAATDDVALDHGDLSPHPRRMRRRIVTGWAAAEDDKSCAHTVRLRE